MELVEWAKQRKGKSKGQKDQARTEEGKTEMTEVSDDGQGKKIGKLGRSEKEILRKPDIKEEGRKSMQEPS